MESGPIQVASIFLASGRQICSPEMHFFETFVKFGLEKFSTGPIYVINKTPFGKVHLSRLCMYNIPIFIYWKKIHANASKVNKIVKLIS